MEIVTLTDVKEEASGTKAVFEDDSIASGDVGEEETDDDNNDDDDVNVGVDNLELEVSLTIETPLLAVN